MKQWNIPLKTKQTRRKDVKTKGSLEKISKIGSEVLNEF
jgi:hypothetical protein